MASAASIRRLHFALEPIGTSPKKDDGIPSLLPAARELPVRRRFARFALPARAEPEAGYSLAPEIMGPTGPAAPLDRSFQFAAMAERERLQAVAQRYLAARGMHGR
jgi:hypothetical protein